MKCEAYFSFEGESSYDRIVAAKLQLSLHRNMKQIIKTTRYEWSSLTKRNISNKYSVTVRNKFNTLQDISERHTPEKKIVSANIEATAECIATKPRPKCRVLWESQVSGKTKQNKKKTKNKTKQKKRDNFKKASLLHKRIPTNTNAQKLKAQKNLTHTKKSF